MSIWTNISAVSTVVSVELVCNEVGNIVEIQSAKFRFIKNEFDMISEPKQFQDIESLIGFYGKYDFFVLSLTGKCVLNKFIPSYDSSRGILTQAIPNIEESDFYFSSIIKENQAWVSFSRMEFVKKVMNVFISKNSKILQLNIGPLEVNKANYQSLVENGSNFSNKDFIFDFESPFENYLQKNISECVDEFRVFEKHYSTKFAIAIFGALGYFADKKFQPQGLDYIVFSRKEGQFFVGNKKLKTWGVSFIFVLTFSSFAINTFLFEKHSQLLQDNENKEILFHKIQTLKKQLTQQKQVLMEVEPANANRTAQFLDQIGASVPENIVLRELKLNPLTQKIKLDSKLAVRENHIEIIGIIKNELELNIWITSLNKLDWISSVEVIEYKRKERSNYYLFKILMAYSNE